MTIELDRPLAASNLFTVRHLSLPQTLYRRCFHNYYHAAPLLSPQCTYLAGYEPLFKHWQLRDMLRYCEDRNTIFYTQGESIYETSMDSRDFATKRYCSLGYRPLCISNCTSGLVVAGGLSARYRTKSSSKKAYSVESLPLPNAPNDDRKQQGIFSVYNPILDVEKSVHLGLMINNDVGVYQDNCSHDSTAYVCNNDSHLYAVQIATSDRLSVTSRIQCSPHTCLNQSARNPVHRNMVAVTSDGPRVFIVDPMAGKVVNSINTSHDLGFGVSYHHNGYLLAALFQDGNCALYDIRAVRNHQPLVEIELTRRGSQVGSFRACKFSPSDDSHDLLAILEHAGRVHIVDMRDLTPESVRQHQVIVVPHALDQYGTSKAQEQDKKMLPVPIYSGANLFTAPLVYDYDYVSTTNPRLFTKFQYVAPSDNKSFKVMRDCAKKDDLPSSASSLMDPWDDYGSDDYADVSVHAQSVFDEIDWPHPPGSRHHCRKAGYDLVNGEMELCGVEFINALPSFPHLRLAVACNGGGVLLWTLNSAQRRSSPVADLM